MQTRASCPAAQVSLRPFSQPRRNFIRRELRQQNIVFSRKARKYEEGFLQA
jgi:hypothetical protein